MAAVAGSQFVALVPPELEAPPLPVLAPLLVLAPLPEVAVPPGTPFEESSSSSEPPQATAHAPRAAMTRKRTLREWIAFTSILLENGSAERRRFRGGRQRPRPSAFARTKCERSRCHALLAS